MHKYLFTEFCSFRNLTAPPELHFHDLHLLLEHCLDSADYQHRVFQKSTIRSPESIQAE